MNVDKTGFPQLTEKSLPIAIGKLFEMNNYDVRYGVQIHGAEVDIVAISRGDPFAPKVYIEATVQYVDNTKYGKDSTKFILIREKEQGATCISISTAGFTAAVLERASNSRIQMMTYEELFKSFEKFSPYIESVLADRGILELAKSYEQPFLKDKLGTNPATEWLSSWMSEPSPQSKWLIILGEYGTGKTSLTQMLQLDWASKYKKDVSAKLPIRIELRNFSRQFDASSLLHHFLDTNNLQHVPILFLMHLIKSGRVILILDGYDEMAQFLNARERRACLSALAELASEGARGILTSRPNYFTEAEELNVFDALYTSLEQNKYYLGQADKMFLANEKDVDNLIENYVLNRQERYLRDLDEYQTESLVKRKLSNDIKGQKVVLDVLRTVFRDDADGPKQSLGGKPVIISYLLEVLDSLKQDVITDPATSLTEWQIYKLIIDKLMMRDLHRSPTLMPTMRRIALQLLAIVLSKKDTPAADEHILLQIIDDVFSSQLKRLTPDERRIRRDELFQDIRSSATLTRSEVRPSGWLFSHNSLREYLVAEAFIGRATEGREPTPGVPISSAMRSFVGSIEGEARVAFVSALRDLWPQRGHIDVGTYLSLGWEMLRKSDGGLAENLSFISGVPSERALDLTGIGLDRFTFSNREIGREDLKMMASGSRLTEGKIEGFDLSGSSFDGCTFDRIIFIRCKFGNTNFQKSLLFECEFLECVFEGGDFTGIDSDSNIIVNNGGGALLALSGLSIVGYLAYHGATTNPIDPYYRYHHHPKFSIVDKICENIQDQKNSQKRGLTQRGAANQDPKFARAFVDYLENEGLIEVDQNDLVSATPEGRRQLPLFSARKVLPSGMERFLADWL